jgi:hypothetical protein
MILRYVHYGDFNKDYMILPGVRYNYFVEDRMAILDDAPDRDFCPAAVAVAAVVIVVAAVPLPHGCCVCSPSESELGTVDG